jgi:Chaperone of endosialidase
MKSAKKIITIAVALLLTADLFSQNMGIGTTNPIRAKLEVVGVSGSGNTSAIFGTDGAGISLQTNWPTIGFNQYRDAPTLYGKYMASGFAVIQYFDPTTGTMIIDNQNTGAINTNTVQGFRLITISNTGNVGIRITNPSASLTVARGEGFEGTAVLAGPQHWSHFNYATGEDTYIRCGAGIGVSSGKVFLNGPTNGKVLIGSGATKVGIGNPGQALTATIQQAFVSASGDQFGLIDNFNNRWAQRINNGLGTMRLDFRYLGVQKGYFSSSTGVYALYSDRRLKNDIQPLQSVLSKIKLLNAVSYEMINHNPDHKRSIGFIAQDIKPIFPSLVHVIDDHARSGERHKDLHTMNYTGFNVVIIKALQEQYQQLKELETEQQELLTRLNELNKKISN